MPMCKKINRENPKIKMRKKLLIPVIMLQCFSSLVLAMSDVNSKFAKESQSQREKEMEREDKLANFIYLKVISNSLVLLKEERDKEGKEVIHRSKIDKDSTVTGVSCNSFRDFLKNEGLNSLLSGHKNGKVSVNELNQYFSTPELQKHFSSRTLKILKDDVFEQIKTMDPDNVKPQICFAEIKESSNVKHVVYLNHTIIENQVSDYNPEYVLYDFTFDENYLSLRSKGEQP